MLLALFLILLGIGLLYAGGEILVESSIRLAQVFGLSKMVIGLTVVAFATSSPELAATLTAALHGSPDIAIGNVVGSNVANLGLILGLSVIVMPIAVKRQFLRREMAFMTFATIVVYPLMLTDFDVTRLEGVFLIALLVFFLWTLMQSKDDEALASCNAEVDTKPQRPTWQAALGVGLGIALLVVGAQTLISGASTIARALGITDRVIGLTIVAFGTSLPELAASVIAARRREGDLVLGNLIGSNIFNLLCILGLTAIVHPISVSQDVMRLDFWVMLAISLLVLIFLATSLKMHRTEGWILLVIYCGYIVFLFR